MPLASQPELANLIQAVADQTLRAAGVSDDLRSDLAGRIVALAI
jgi:hypothetical protein